MLPKNEDALVLENKLKSLAIVLSEKASRKISQLPKSISLNLDFENGKECLLNKRFKEYYSGNLMSEKISVKSGADCQNVNGVLIDVCMHVNVEVANSVLLASVQSNYKDSSEIVNGFPLNASSELVNGEISLAEEWYRACSSDICTDLQKSTGKITEPFISFDDNDFMFVSRQKENVWHHLFEIDGQQLVPESINKQMRKFERSTVPNGRFVFFTSSGALPKGSYQKLKKEEFEQLLDNTMEIYIKCDKK